MNKVAAPSNFLCTLPGQGKGIAYHVAVSFLDSSHPSGVRFTSFVGDGRRSFGVQAGAVVLTGEFADSCEALCRLAIGQAIRDHLYDKAGEGDFVLDLGAVPWEGELRPVGSRVGASMPRMRFPG
ncbi:hypothetical protein P3W85_24690 [Cupriavidus basilensis]|uniref:Uncharacterized protein n=1 Tax=Cupriavidus basilensis TaxID=68895 RepID=A0ABT6AUH8_9BURK|nr:hypothetical protein [Cupriavidus basilensis]MDF3836124.1 hypothetical protein [Cupriavidus basilensis]